MEKNLPFENGFQLPNIAPFKVQSTSIKPYSTKNSKWIITPIKNKSRCDTLTSNTYPKATKNSQWKVTPKDPLPSTSFKNEVVSTTIPKAMKNSEWTVTPKHPLPSTSFKNEVDSTASTEIINFNEIYGDKNPFVIPNFDSPPLSPLLGEQEMRHEGVSSRLNTPHPTIRR